MIAGSVSYAGLYGKTKAMLSKRIKASDYAELKNKSSILEIASFLKNHPGYAPIFADVPESRINRVSLESLLTKKAHYDFIKLIRYTNEKDINFLKYYIYQNEVNQILKYIRLIMANKTADYEYEPLKLFKDHSRVDFSQFKKFSTLDEFIDFLENTPYYNILLPYKDKSDYDYTQIEITLETYYFTLLFKLIDKHVSFFDKKELKAFTYDTIDILNFTRILRSITMDQPRETIYSNLIPFAHDLSKDIITQMISAETAKDAFEIINKTKFKDLFKDLKENKKYIEFYYYQYVCDYTSKILSGTTASIRLIYAYIWHTEIEIKNLIHIIEAKNYNLSVEETEKFLIGIKKER